MKYNKLVRDKIPGIILAKGKTPSIHVAGKEEYWAKLKEKLSEEVSEFLESESEEEIADVLEVLYAITEFKGSNFEKIDALRKKKRAERGGFKKRIILDESR